MLRPRAAHVRVAYATRGCVRGAHSHARSSSHTHEGLEGRARVSRTGERGAFRRAADADAATGAASRCLKGRKEGRTDG